MVCFVRAVVPELLSQEMDFTEDDDIYGLHDPIYDAGVDEIIMLTSSFNLCSQHCSNE